MPARDCEALKKRGDILTSSFQIRSLKAEDIPKLMTIRRDLKIHDASSCLLSAMICDPEAIKIVETNKGEIIGSCSAVKITSDLYFVGLYCLREEYRGLGIGIEVWNSCMEHVGARNAALNAVPEKMKIYREKGGFSIAETEFTCIKNFTDKPINPKLLSNNLPKDVTIHLFKEQFLPAMLEYDFRLMGYKRELALALSCTEQDSRTFVALRNGMCVGFGSIKTSCLGAGRVSPLYADEPSIAEALLKSLVISLPNTISFAMMTLSSNVPAHRMLRQLGCPKKEELTRLYSKEKINVDTSKIFAVMDLNFALF